MKKPWRPGDVKSGMCGADPFDSEINKYKAYWTATPDEIHSLGCGFPDVPCPVCDAGNGGIR